MKAGTVAFNGEKADTEELLVIIKSANKELTGIRKANHVADAEIRRLQTSTRKTLERIRRSLRQAEATH